VRTEFGWGRLREEDKLEDPNVNGKIWIDMAQNRNRRLALVNVIIKFQFIKTWGNVGE
jgi:hypothetical protein